MDHAKAALLVALQERARGYAEGIGLVFDDAEVRERTLWEWGVFPEQFGRMPSRMAVHRSAMDHMAARGQDLGIPVGIVEEVMAEVFGVARFPDPGPSGRYAD